MRQVEILKRLGYNPHSVGIVMKELVNRAMNIIRQQRFDFEMSSKIAYDGKGKDVYSTADTGAQAVYIRGIVENFPYFGIIAEEEKFFQECTIPGHDIYFTIDPLCGTKAYGRKQSFGIATMIALVVNGVVVSAYIGDVIAHEIYGYRPGSDSVWRIWRSGDYDRAVRLRGDVVNPLSDQYALLTDADCTHSDYVQLLIKGNKYRSNKDHFIIPLTLNYDIMRGSIGLHYARLWKGEVGLLVLRSRLNTPWDTTPVIGISEKLGFLHLHVLDNGLKYVISENALIKTVTKLDNEVIVIHRSRLKEFINWQNKVLDTM